MSTWKVDLSIFWADSVDWLIDASGLIAIIVGFVAVFVLAGLPGCL
jgi:hypothetical protein